ncbi:50S ribosomal protein L21 [Candidatus Daviesbacteria bacterium RIFCSPHIGHO2_02_FULL_39_12]|uniref:50S ribosomal protein L21 n=2 Tax=Candidatus Daviesiibacteriota TaxID=1752718 RepID=A0A1F5JC34_9BACT|nr:MAG: 50S ribosomal protein L21 [Candidatus Daviesbacteria bacterium RIFCSPHIGHO2_02_FULL_39_12]OGE72017.1 MAG: 50S ribosomal protein L21 [Candidatus Daviesbacteria bacterium RIFCSPLOWO2_02_FULL_38_15]
MFDYAICEINSKQYKILPNQPIEVDWLAEAEKKIEANILLFSENGKIKLGTPYLKEKLTLDCLETVKGTKIRVAKFHAKANFRKVTGARPKRTKVIYSVKKD